MPKFKKNPNAKSAMYKKAYTQPPLPMVEGTKAHKDALAKASPVQQIDPGNMAENMSGPWGDALSRGLNVPGKDNPWISPYNKDRAGSTSSGSYEQFKDYWE